MSNNTRPNPACLNISAAREDDLVYIREKIVKYLLDGTNLDYRQFFVLRQGEKIVAFGRIIERDGDGYFEIASLGVDYYQRKRGLGSKLLEFLVAAGERRDNRKPIYVVTHRPEFFHQAGFVEVGKYPDYLGYKKDCLCHWDGSRIKVMMHQDTTRSKT